NRPSSGPKQRRSEPSSRSLAMPAGTGVHPRRSRSKPPFPTVRASAMRLPLPVLAAVLLAAPLLLAAPAAAQHRWIAPGFPSPPASITERRLDAVAAAMTAMAMVKHSYRQMMASAAPADRQRLASEAQSALAKAVTDQGISLADFRGILE